MSEAAIAPPSSTAADTPAVESTPTVETSSTTAETPDTSAQAEPTLEDNIAEALRSLESEDQPERVETAATESQSETDEDRFNRENELEPGFHKKRDNRIPHKRVTEMVSKAQAKILKELTGVDVPAGTKLEDFVAQQKTVFAETATKTQTYEQRLANVEKVEKIMQDDPAQYLQLLAQTFPAYAELLGGRVDAGAGRRDAPANDEMPQPDYELAPGQFTYSVEGLQKRDEWLARQVEARILKQFSPLTEKLEQEKQALAAQQLIEANIPAATKHLERMEATRPLFKEHKREILAKLQADAQLTVEDAYWDVVGPKLHTDRNRMRQEIIEEQKRIPRSTSATGNAPTRQTDESDLDARIATAIKGL